MRKFMSYQLYYVVVSAHVLANDRIKKIIIVLGDTG